MKTLACIRELEEGFVIPSVSKYPSSAITTLAVGLEEQEYKVHEDLLSQHPPSFASATKEDWKEGQEHCIP
jgi:hypothetical protein